MYAGNLVRYSGGECVICTDRGEQLTVECFGVGAGCLNVRFRSSDVVIGKWTKDKATAES
jgi:hypothetical protein